MPPLGRDYSDVMFSKVVRKVLKLSEGVGGDSTLGCKGVCENMCTSEWPSPTSLVPTPLHSTVYASAGFHGFVAAWPSKT